MKKPKKKTVIILCAVAAAAAVTVGLTVNGAGGTALPVMTAPLEVTDLANNVSATGSVVSANAVNVYTNLQYPIKSVHIKVGDKVSAGDVLCELDTEKLELDIQETVATINADAAAAQHDINVSERKYTQAQEDLQNNLDQNVTAAEARLESARLGMKQAKDNYMDSKYEYGKFEDDDDDDDEITVGVSSGSKTYTKGSKRIEMEKNWQLYDAARLEYKNALQNLEVTTHSSKTGLNDYQDSIERSRITSNTAARQIALQKLRLDLEDSVVTAPISGTVTAVYAKEGAAGGGLLFVVEDTDNLLIKTKLREYDITTVKEGMPVTIKSDATGEDVFDGEVQRISPAAVKGENGTTKTDGSVEFETDVALVTEDSGLRIGMNVRLNIITAKKEGVWAVPFDAVTTDAQGQSILYVARPGEKDKQVAAAVPVTTGMETDFYIEITSDSLEDGDFIITDPSNITDGMEILPTGAGASTMQLTSSTASLSSSSQPDEGSSGQDGGGQPDDAESSSSEAAGDSLNADSEPDGAAQAASSEA